MYQLLYPADADIEPILELEFDQTVRLYTCAAQMAHAAERGCLWFRCWLGAVSVVDCQCRRIEGVQFLRVRPANPVNPFLN